MMQMMQSAFLASPPLKNHLQHNLKKPSIRPPSSPSMCRVYVYLLRATPARPPNYSLRSPSTTQLAPSTKAGFRNYITKFANLPIFKNTSMVYEHMSCVYYIVYINDLHVIYPTQDSCLGSIIKWWLFSERALPKKVLGIGWTSGSPREAVFFPYRNP